MVRYAAAEKWLKSLVVRQVQVLFYLCNVNLQWNWYAYAAAKKTPEVYLSVSTESLVRVVAVVVKYLKSGSEKMGLYHSIPPLPYPRSLGKPAWGNKAMVPRGIDCSASFVGHSGPAAKWPP